MKKTILSLMAITSLSLAGDYEFTVGGGMNKFADSINMEDSRPLLHLSAQYNGFVIKPQLVYEKVFGSKYADIKIDTKIDRVFLNAVYEFTDSGFIPYALVGIGHESVSNYLPDRFHDHATLLNGGLGFKFPIGSFALKLEGRYMKRIFAGGTQGHEIVGIAGLAFAFGGEKPAPKPVVEKKPAPQPEPVVEEKKVEEKPKPVVEEKPVATTNFVLEDVRFDVDSTRIKPEYKDYLNRLVDYLNSNPNVTLTIEGHTDSTGSRAYNKRLSIRRAKAVRRYLVRKGISKKRLSIVGYGEDRPIASNKTKEGRAMNRRVSEVE